MVPANVRRLGHAWHFFTLIFPANQNFNKWSSELLPQKLLDGFLIQESFVCSSQNQNWKTKNEKNIKEWEKKKKENRRWSKQTKQEKNPLVWIVKKYSAVCVLSSLDATNVSKTPFVPAAAAAGGFQIHAETKAFNETPSLGYLVNVSLHLSPSFTPAHTDSHPENIYYPLNRQISVSKIAPMFQEPWLMFLDLIK